MGWSYTRADNLIEEENIVRHEFTFVGENISCTVLDMVKVGNVYYQAVERINKSGERYVFCGVVLTAHNNSDPRFNFGVKTMSEEEGPYYYDCPVKIMKMLSAPEDEGSKEWRKTVCEIRLNKNSLATKIRKAKIPGATILFEKPLRFSNGKEATRFVYRGVVTGMFGKKNHIYDSDNGITSDISSCLNKIPFEIVG
jgi:hypothetical protein